MQDKLKRKSFRNKDADDEGDDSDNMTLKALEEDDELASDGDDTKSIGAQSVAFQSMRKSKQGGDEEVKMEGENVKNVNVRALELFWLF